MLGLTLRDYAWYYLYHAPRTRLDSRYRNRQKEFEALLREAYRRGLINER
jgi:hypothetical protein